MAENDKNEDDDEKDTLSRQQLNVLIAIAVISIIIVIFYIYQFYGNLGGQERFGQFGDYVGGILNPVLTFATIYLLISSINIQLRDLKITRRELELTRKELKQSADALDLAQEAHHKSYGLQLNEVTRIQLQQALDEQYAAFNSIWTRPLLESSPNPNIPNLSLEDIFDLKKCSDIDPVISFVGSVSERMGVGNQYVHDVETIALKDLKSILRRICQFTHAIYKNLESPPIASALHTKAGRLNDKLLSINVISDKEYNINKPMIRLPNNLNDLLR